MRNMGIHLKKAGHLVLLFLLVLVCTKSMVVDLYASQSNTNYETGYQYVLEDSASFIKEESEILDLMEEITQYCNVAVVTTEDHSYSSTERYAVAEFESCFGNGADGVIFVIDRDLNEIYLASEGETQRIISSSRCKIICDNTYIYATEGHNYDYDTCCKETLIQVKTLLEGGKISQPMRYASNIFIALAIGMILCFFYLFVISRNKKASSEDMLIAIYTNVQVYNPSVQYVGETKKYSPQSSGGGGSHHSSHHSSGHSGGHSGGGHHI